MRRKTGIERWREKKSGSTLRLNDSSGSILRPITVQGGSDKSGILKIFFENQTAQLKIIRFY
jgi:hypothetical protein